MENAAREIIENVSRAVRLNTSLFLIVYYEQESAKVEFLGKLRENMVNAGMKTRTIDPVFNPGHQPPKLRSYLNSLAKEGEICLLTILPRAKESTRLEESFLEYLNLHRDELFANRLRLILFMHQSDARQFIDTAGDLWDFRHHTYWLEREKPSSELLWKNLEFQARQPHVSGGDSKEVEKHVKEVRALVNRTPDEKEKAALLLDLSRWLLRRNLAIMAVETISEAKRYISDDYSKIGADLESELGYALKLTANLPEAMEHYMNSLNIARKIGYSESEAMTLNNISFIYQTWGDYSRALTYLEKGLKIFKKIGDRESEITVSDNIAYIYAVMGDYERALSLLEINLKAYSEIQSPESEAVTLSVIGNIHLNQGRFMQAMHFYNKSLEIRKEKGLRVGELRTLNNIALVYFSLKDYGAALEILEENLVASKNLKNRELEGDVLRHLSVLLHSMGRNEEALNHYEKLLAICIEIGDRAGEAETRWSMALLYGEFGWLNKAFAMFRKAIEIEKDIDHPKFEEHKKYLEKLEKPL